MLISIAQYSCHLYYSKGTILPLNYFVIIFKLCVPFLLVAYMQLRPREIWLRVKQQQKNQLHKISFKTVDSYCQLGFHTVCINLSSHQQSVRWLSSPHSHQHNVFIVANLIGEVWMASHHFNLHFSSYEYGFICLMLFVFPFLCSIWLDSWSDF